LLLCTLPCRHRRLAHTPSPSPQLFDGGRFARDVGAELHAEEAAAEAEGAEEAEEAAEAEAEASTEEDPSTEADPSVAAAAAASEAEAGTSRAQMDMDDVDMDDVDMDYVDIDDVDMDDVWDAEDIASSAGTGVAAAAADAAIYQVPVPFYNLVYGPYLPTL
jgi:hypothetical protein